MFFTTYLRVRKNVFSYLMLEAWSLGVPIVTTVAHLTLNSRDSSKTPRRTRIVRDGDASSPPIQVQNYLFAKRVWLQSVKR